MLPDNFELEVKTMHVNLQDLIRLRQNAVNLTLPAGVEDACQSMCCANPGQEPSSFTTVKDFVDAHALVEASPFFAMPVDELVGHGTVCGAVPNAFTQDFVTLIKTHGATTVVFFASFSCRNIVDEQADTVDLLLSGSGYDADYDQPLADNWRDGLSQAVIDAIEATGATTLGEAHEAFPGNWSWRPESAYGWTVCESE